MVKAPVSPTVPPALAVDPMFVNAIDSIRMGVEDFESPSPARLHSAIRNLHSGVVILCKVVLARMAPEGWGPIMTHSAFVFRRNASHAVPVPKGHSLDVGQIEERFRQLAIKVDFGRLSSLSAIRNEIEHAATSASKTLARQALERTFAVVSDLFNRYLQVLPATASASRPGPLCGRTLRYPNKAAMLCGFETSTTVNGAQTADSSLKWTTGYVKVF